VLYVSFPITTDGVELRIVHGLSLNMKDKVCKAACETCILHESKRQSGHHPAGMLCHPSCNTNVLKSHTVTISASLLNYIVRKMLHDGLVENVIVLQTYRQRMKKSLHRDIRNLHLRHRGISASYAKWHTLCCYIDTFVCCVLR
jgi:hypothetical protein